jgi:hypothetical protein
VSGNLSGYEADSKTIITILITLWTLNKWRQRHSSMEGKNVLLEEEIMSQGDEQQRGRRS